SWRRPVDINASSITLDNTSGDIWISNRSSAGELKGNFGAFTYNDTSTALIFEALDKVKIQGGATITASDITFTAPELRFGWWGDPVTIDATNITLDNTTGDIWIGGENYPS